MMTKCLTLLLFFVVHLTNASEIRLLGDFEIRMHSRSSSDINDVLFQVLSITVNFLDAKFEQFFSESATIDFEETSLSALSYDMEEVADSHMGTVHLEGRAFFASGTSPSQDDVMRVTKEIFRQHKRQLLQALQKSDDHFLKHILNVEVTVDGSLVEDNLNDESDSKLAFLSSLSKLTIIASAVSIVLLCIVLICLIWFCCKPVEDDEYLSSSRGRSREPVVKMAPSKEGTRRTANEEDSYMRRSPSPLRSITSQDSSVFTYNPKSCKSLDTRTLSSFQTNNTHLDLDVEAWQKGSMVPKDAIPFGHDISAIENKKDLSLIEEGSETGEEPTPDRRNLTHTRSNRRSSKQKLRLTESSLDDLERFERSERRIKRSSSRASSQSSRRSIRSKKTIDLEADAAEVINDLKDLSFQIDRYRRS